MLSRLGLALALLASPAAAHDEVLLDPSKDCPRLCLSNGFQEWTGLQVRANQADPLSGAGLIWSTWCECIVPADQLAPGHISETRGLRLRHVTYVEEPSPALTLAAGVAVLAVLAHRRSRQR